MTDDAMIPDETTDADADEQSSWVMIATTCGACQGARFTVISAYLVGTGAYVNQTMPCQECGGSGRVLRRERSGGNG